MKSSFLLTILVTAMTASVASAQMSSRPSPQDMKPNQKTTFDKFYERLKISYFGVLTTPHLDDISHSHYDNAAISPEFSGKGDAKNRDTWPTNVWNQIAFSYNFGAKLSFVVAPRWMTPLSHPVDMKEPEDRSLIALEDALVGFGGVIHSSEDKKFNLWIRPAMRLPVSKASRNSGQAGAGQLSQQLEFAYNATYDFNKTWQLGLFGQLRQWVIEDRYQFDRFRIYTAPFIQYTINDTSRLQLYYENMLETNRRGEPVDDRDPKFYDVWQNMFLGYSVDVTSKFNIMPFTSVYVNDTPFRVDGTDITVNQKAFWFGAWISYSIK